MTDTLTFDVEGMTCASCAVRIERVLGRQDGVTSAVVSLTGKQATVAVTPDADEGELVEAVERIGYGITHRSDDGETLAERYDEETRYQRVRAVLAALFTLPAFALTMFGPESQLVDTAVWALVTPVVFGFGWQFHRTAALLLRSRGANMDTLISMGTLAAYGYSVWAFFTDRPVFFETAAWIITFILLGRFFEARSKGSASRAITRLLELAANDARVLRDGAETVIPIEELVPGDRMVVRPGERVPTDGRIVEGHSAFDESFLSGESTPVDKGAGDEIYGATINQHGLVIVEVTRIGAETALAQIVRLVEDAQSTKAPIQRLADRVASVFVPIVLLIAVVTLTMWLVLSNDATSAVRAAVAVLIIACPCALGLATPTAILVGSGRGAELGILFKDAEVFERARRVSTVVFDKTGTLTRGAMTLSRVEADDMLDALRLVAAVEAGSEHPIGRAVALGAEERGVDFDIADDIESLPGRGIRGTVAGVEVAVGSPKLMAEMGLLVPERFQTALETMESEGATAFLAGWNGEARAAFAVADTVRHSTRGAITSLRDQGLSTAMLTGDNRRTAETIAAAIGIDRVMAEVLPGDKSAEIARLQDEGERVAFVGDGVNDAPALVQADLGLAIGTGTDVAIEAGDVILTSGDPAAAVTALALAERTFGTIRQNLFWAFAYNTAAIPLAALGVLNPMIAAAAMALSSVSVVGNSLRLRRYQPA